jgi:hypothetical protein
MTVGNIDACTSSAAWHTVAGTSQSSYTSYTSGGICNMSSS